MKPCAFCPNPATTTKGEHLFDDWVNLPDCVPRGYFSIETTKGQPSTRESARRLDVTLPVACNDCNHGWMSDLTNYASKILRGSVFDDTPTRFGPDEIVTIAAYGVMKAIVYERGRGVGRHAFSPAVARRFAETIEVPSGVQVWIARSQSRHLHGARALLGAAFFNRTHRGYKLTVFSYALNHFVCQVTYPTWEKQRPATVGLPFVRQTERWDDVAIPIWPDVQSADWSGLTPLNDARFDEFGERWKHAEVRRPSPSDRLR